ncbi:MAG: VOC family protein [Chloroflexota bacterium]|nr:VOC family protein [Chloroflexota bacterium]
MSLRSNKLVPELSVSNFEKSVDFYVRVLGFSIAYQRKKEGFAFLALGEAQIMIDETGKGRTWKTAEFDYPLGRGVNFQIEVEDIQTIVDCLRSENIELFLETEEKWYRKNGHEVGNKQFLVKDPDGYLLRFTENLGTRPVT